MATAETAHAPRHTGASGASVSSKSFELQHTSSRTLRDALYGPRPHAQPRSFVMRGEQTSLGGKPPLGGATTTQNPVSANHDASDTCMVGVQCGANMGGTAWQAQLMQELGATGQAGVGASIHQQARAGGRVAGTYHPQQASGFAQQRPSAAYGAMVQERNASGAAMQHAAMAHLQAQLALQAKQQAESQSLVSSAVLNQANRAAGSAPPDLGSGMGMLAASLHPSSNDVRQALLQAAATAAQAMSNQQGFAPSAAAQAAVSTATSGPASALYQRQPGPVSAQLASLAGSHHGAAVDAGVQLSPDGREAVSSGACTSACHPTCTSSHHDPRELPGGSAQSTATGIYLEVESSMVPTEHAGSNQTTPHTGGSVHGIVVVAPRVVAGMGPCGSAPPPTTLYVYRPAVYPEHTTPAALSQANAVMSKLTIPGGLAYMPVAAHSSLFREGTRFGFTAFSITLGSSYFQRLLAAMPHLEYAVRRGGPAFADYCETLPRCSERRWAALHAQYGPQYGSSTSVTEESTLASIQFTCVYLACKLVDRVPMLDMLRYMLTHLYGSLVSRAQAYDVESKCLEGLGFRLGPYFRTDELAEDWPF